MKKPRQLTTREAVQKYCDDHGLSKELGHVEILRNKFYITAAGLRVMAHQQGVQSVKHEILHADYKNNVYAFKTIVTMKGEDGELKTFEDFGSSSGSGVGKGGKDGHALMGHAATRSTARAYRLALDVPLPVFEESGEYVKQQERQSTPSRQQNQQPVEKPWQPKTPLAPVAFQVQTNKKDKTKCTRDQVVKYQTLCGEQKWTDTNKHFMLRNLAGVESSNDLTKSQMSFIIQHLVDGRPEYEWCRNNFVPLGHNDFPKYMDFLKKNGRVLELLVWSKLEEEHKHRTSKESTNEDQ